MPSLPSDSEDTESTGSPGALVTEAPTPHETRVWFPRIRRLRDHIRAALDAVPAPEYEDNPTEKWGKPEWNAFYAAMSSGLIYTCITFGIPLLLMASPLGWGMGLLPVFATIFFGAYLGYCSVTLERYPRADSTKRVNTELGDTELDDFSNLKPSPKRPRFEWKHHDYAILGAYILSIFINIAIFVAIAVTAASSVALLTNPYTLAAMASCIVLLGIGTLWFHYTNKTKARLDSDVHGRPLGVVDERSDWERDRDQLYDYSIRIPARANACFSAAYQSSTTSMSNALHVVQRIPTHIRSCFEPRTYQP